MSCCWYCCVHSAALSVSEATERSIRFAHEKHNLLHELHRTESELQTARAEITRCKEEIATTRSKMKTFHADKIDADKKVAIYLGNKSKLEVWELNIYIVLIQHEALQLLLQLLLLILILLLRLLLLWSL